MRRWMKQFSFVIVLVTAWWWRRGSDDTYRCGINASRSDGFYFQGLSAPTQMRNSAAARFGADRYVISGLVDTSGYSADVRAKYVGFLITDSAITLNGESLPSGAYGFGFATERKDDRHGPGGERSTLGAGHQRQRSATPAPVDDVCRRERRALVCRQRLRRHRCQVVICDAQAVPLVCFSLLLSLDIAQTQQPMGGASTGAAGDLHFASHCGITDPNAPVVLKT